MNALRSGEFVPPQDDGYDPNADLRVLQGTHKRKTREHDTYMSREQLMELRKVQAERVEVCDHVQFTESRKLIALGRPER